MDAIAGWIARGGYAIVLVLLIWWQAAFLGGYSFTPTTVKDDGDVLENSTGSLFNLHPLLMIITFMVLMMESILTQKVPILPIENKATKKAIHFSIMILAFITGVTGVVFAFLSHTMKKPDPIPNLYSAHSYMGLLTMIVFLIQLVVGFSGFLINKNEARKIAYAALHRPMGVACFLLGVGTILMGLQEKAGFVKTDDNTYQPIIALTGWIALLVVMTAACGLAPWAMGGVGAMMDKALGAAGEVMEQAEQAQALLENVPGAGGLASRLGV